MALKRNILLQMFDGPSNIYDEIYYFVSSQRFPHKIIEVMISLFERLGNRQRRFMMNHFFKFPRIKSKNPVYKLFGVRTLNFLFNYKFRQANFRK